MWMGVRRAVGMRVLVNVFGIQVHVELHAGNSHFLTSPGAQVPAIKPEFFEFMLKGMGIHAKINHRADEHVAADAAEDVEKEGFHKLQIPSSKLQRSSKRQAPTATKATVVFCNLEFGVFLVIGAWRLEL